MTINNERFEELCRKCSSEFAENTSIGTYREKRLHMILKRLACQNSEFYEVKIGDYIADVCFENEIIEIQTGSLYPLREKLRYYLESTDFNVTVLYPVVAEKQILRVERETGEVVRARKSPKRVTLGDVMQEISWLSELISSPRICIKVLYISVDEHRYSDEAVRYRRSGKYDREIFPRSLLRHEEYRGADAFLPLLENCPSSFLAKDYSMIKGISGRKLYRTLNLLCTIGLLTRHKQGKSYLYEKQT